jgi:hypothetical protein
MDALSRHVGVVEETNFMDKEVIINEQKKGLFCKEQA